jgi:carbamoylphosphate synthase small subunit
MIKGFEEESKPLTPEEAKLIEPLVKGFNGHTGEENAIKAHEIIESMKKWCSNNDVKITFNGSRLRKLVNHIRLNGLIEELIATSKGYWVETNREKIKDCITSLHQRANAIQAVSSAMANRWDKTTT